MRRTFALCVVALVIVAARTASADGLGPLHKAAFAGDTEFVKAWIATPSPWCASS